MSDAKQQQPQQFEDDEDALTEARELFMESDLEQALVKFKEAAEAAAADKSRWPEVLAAETGQAEVAIQKREWNVAADQLTAAIAAADAAAKSADDDEDEDASAAAAARDLTRAHYMLGIALLGKKKIEEAKAELELARGIATDAIDAVDMLSDIQDRLEQLDEVEEEDLVEIALEFGVAPEASIQGDDDDEEEEDFDEEDVEEDEEEEEEEEEDEEALTGKPMANSRKRPAAVPLRANGDTGDDDDDEDEADYDEDDEEGEEEEDDEQAVPTKRAKQAGAGSRNGRRAVAGGAGDDEDEEDEEVSSSA